MVGKEFADASAPKWFYLYAVTDLSVNFDDVEDLQEDKDVTTGLKKIEKGQMVRLQNEPKNMAKFKKLKRLVVYIKSNHGETDKTLVHQISLIRNIPGENKGKEGGKS